MISNSRSVAVAVILVRGIVQRKGGGILPNYPARWEGGLSEKWGALPLLQGSAAEKGREEQEKENAIPLPPR